MAVSANTLDPLSGLMAGGTDLIAVTLVSSTLAPGASGGATFLAAAIVDVTGQPAFGETAPTAQSAGSSIVIEAIDDAANTLTIGTVSIGSGGLVRSTAMLYVIGFSPDALLLSAIPPQTLATTLQAETAGGIDAVTQAQLGVFVTAAPSAGTTIAFTAAGSYVDAPLQFTPDPATATGMAPGDNGLAPYSVTLDDAALAAALQPALDRLTEGVEQGSISWLRNTGSSPPDLAAGLSGFIDDWSAAPLMLRAGYAGAIDEMGGPIIATAAGNHLIVGQAGAGANHDLTYAAATGADTVFGGNGNAVIYGGGASLLAFDEGATTLIGGAAGNTVAGGLGAQLIFGVSTLNYAGGAGAATLIGGATGNTVTGGAGSLLAFASSGLTYAGGTGAATLIGGGAPLIADLGSGGGIAYGSPGGGNALSNSGGASILVGGGSGDVLTDTGNGTDLLVAAGGSETLNGAGASGPLVIFGGSGGDVLAGGGGNDAILAGSANETLSGGGGNDSFIFLAAPGTTRTDIVTDFDPSHDAIGLFGYGAEPVAGLAALASATATGGSTVLALPDGTTILLSGTPSLKSYNFF